MGRRVPLGELAKGNVRTFAVRDTLLAITAALAGGLDTLYFKTVLGADTVALGLLASVWSAVFLVLVLLGGWVADRYSRKKTLLVGMAITIPNPVIIALSSSWEALLMTNILGAVGSALVTPAYVALLVNSVEQEYRSRAIALISTLTSIANTVTPPLGALLVQGLGGLPQMRPVFAGQAALSMVAWIYTWRRTAAPTEEAVPTPKGMLAGLRDMLSQMKNVYRVARSRKATPWLYIAATGPLAWDIVGPFWIIYVAEVCGTSLQLIGILVSVYSVIHVAIQIPLAGVADRKGRKGTILLTRPFLYICMVLLLLGGSFREWAWTPFVPILAWIMRSIGDSSGPSWTAMSTEVIPQAMQSEWEALRGFVWRLSSIAASLLGGIIWKLDPRLPFLIALLVDVIVRFPIIYRLVPETLVTKGRRIPVLGQDVVIYGLPGAGSTSTARLVQAQLQASILDDSDTQTTGGKKTGLNLEIPVLDEGIGDSSLRKRLDEVLSDASTTIIEGTLGVFAAGEQDKAAVVLLVASKEERVRREVLKTEQPDFVALKEVEDRDRKITRLTRRLYGADISKLPPFDVAINTERVPQDKITKIIAILREDDEDARPSKQ